MLDLRCVDLYSMPISKLKIVTSRFIYKYSAEEILKIAKFAINKKLHNDRYENVCKRIIFDLDCRHNIYLTNKQRGAFYGLLKDDFINIHNSYYDSVKEKDYEFK